VWIGDSLRRLKSIESSTVDTSTGPRFPAGPDRKIPKPSRAVATKDRCSIAAGLPGAPRGCQAARYLVDHAKSGFDDSTGLPVLSYRVNFALGCSYLDLLLSEQGPTRCPSPTLIT
jgi:hypothetical protein